ncbi:SIS domain-containing protein [Biomaibacter acetigenes]|uniref:SIS domain-containing protein n=1 Tax=Biomaibacter acetigenes TaxID=2316383 RepID=UPI001FEA7396|nr:SIS domain-containing protein [Biomaibacter acetigenes]
MVAVRWKGQLNENAKHPAFFNVFPELNHNEIMGYEGDKDLLSKMEIVILRSPDENDRIRKRIDITKSLIEDVVSGVTEIWPKGESALERMLYHIIFGDYVSAYLAILNQKDPTEIDFINALKDRLKS